MGVGSELVPRTFQCRVERLDPQTPQAVYDSKLQAKCFPSFFGKPPTLAAQIDKVSKRWEKEVSAPQAQEPARAHDLHTLVWLYPSGESVEDHLNLPTACRASLLPEHLPASDRTYE